DEGAALRIDAHEPVAEASPVVDAAAILAEHQATARVDREVVGMIAVDRSLAGEERHELVGGRVEGPERAGAVARLAPRIAPGGGVGHQQEAVAEAESLATREQQPAIRPGLGE